MATPKVGAILELDTSDAKKQLKSLDKSKISVDVQIKNLNTLKQLLNKKLSLEADERSFQNAQKRINEITRAIANIKNQIQSVSNSSFLSADTKTNWINQLKSQIKSLQNEKAILQVDKRELTEAHREYQKIVNQIKKLSNEKLNLKGDSSDLEKIDKELKELDTKKRAIEQDALDIQMKLDNYNEVMSQLNNIANTTKRIQNFGKSVGNIGKAMTSIFSGVSNNPIGRLTHFLTQGIGYSSLYRLTSGFMNTIESSFTGAINRLDTIANAERTFLAMDFNNSTIQSSMDDLENRILGLPTTLNDAMQSVTMISSINKDLPKSVRIFDAFNNAILAFGGNQEQANRAITQFSQAMGTGKVDARTYLSLTDAGMSPALAKVAEMLGYSSENMGEFKSALGQGEISIEEFTDALIELNENGYDTMRALNSLAKENALKSIGSSVTVAKTQIEKGWGSIIQSINDSLDALGYGTIPENIANFGNSIRNGMTGIADFINANRDTIGNFLDYISEKFNAFRTELSKFDLSSFVEGMKSFKFVADWIKSSLETLYSTIKSIAKYVGGGDTSKGLGRIAMGYITLAYGFRVLGSAINFLGGGLGVLARLSVLTKSSGKLTNFAKKFTSVFDIFKGKTTGNSKAIGTSLESATTVFDKGKFLNRMGNQLMIASSIANVMLVAEAIKQLNEKIPNDLGQVIPKIAIVGVVISALAGLSTVMGKATKLLSWENQLVGLVALIGSGGALWLLAQAIAEVNDKVPSDIGDFASKMANVVIAIGSIGLVVGALGALASLGSGLGGVIMGLGAVFTLALVEILKEIAVTISKMADAIDDIGKSVKKFGNLKINEKGVENNLKTVTSALDTLTGESTGWIGALGTFAQQKIDEGNISRANTNIKKLLEVAKSLQSIQDIETLNQTKITNNIKGVKKIIEALKESLPLPTVNIENMNAENVEAIAENLEALTTLTNSLSKFSSQELPEVDTEKMKSSITQISSILAKLKEVKFPDVRLGTSLTSENAENVIGVLDNLLLIMPKVNELISKVNETKIDEKAFGSALKSISDLLGKINEDLMPNGQTRIGYNMKEFISADVVENVIRSFENLSKMVTSAKSFMDTFTEANIVWTQLQYNINTMLEALNGTIDGKNAVDIDTEKLSTLETVANTFTTIVGKFETIASKQIDFGVINSIISQIGTVITNIGNLTGADKAEAITSQIETLITKFQEMLSKLSGMSEQFTTIGNDWGTSLYGGFEDSDVIGQCVALIDEMIAELNKKDLTSVGTQYGNQIVNGFRSSISALPSALSSAISGLRNYSGSFASVGRTLGNSFSSAFNSAVSNLKTPKLPSVEKDSKGGLIPTRYYAKGGFARKGTDTVPAMLTPGEFVVRKQAVDKVGVSFLKKINSMDIKGALRSLMSAQGNQSMQLSYNQTINNTSNYNYGDRSVTINGGNERQQRLKANKFMKGLAY